MRLLVFCFLLALPAVISAQDLDRLTPAPVPPQVEPPPPSAAAAEVLSEETAALGSILVDRLEGIVLGPSPEALAAVDAAAGVTVVGAAWLDTPELREGLALFLNRPVDEGTLQSLPTAVRLYLAQLGFPYSLVYLPEQDISEGVVRVVVVRSRLEEEVAIEGARFFSPDLYRGALRVEPGAPLAGQTLQDDLAWINRNPFRSGTLEARAGDEPGTTQLVLRVREVRPVRVFASADNTGTSMTGEERVNAGINWGNVFGLGHQLSAQWSSSWDFKAMRSGSGSYQIDLPWRHSLSFAGAYSRTEGVVAPPFALAGESWQVAANYDLPLASPRSGYTHALQFGADFKASDNNFTFADIPISDNLTHVAQVRTAYSGIVATRGGATSFRATITAAPGGLTDRNDDRFFNVSRAGAKAGYVYFRANALHRIALDRIKRGLSWSIRGEVQFAPGNLIGSEQFGGGGAYSVRGYEEGEVYKDNGFLLSHELRLPPWSPRASPEGPSAGTVQLYVFQDYANLWSADELPGETAVDLHSAGVGFDWFIGRRASLRAAYGWQFLDSGSSESGDNSRLHLSANLSF